ncbi:MAG TPA: chemotaxis protein CheW [Gemmatimonadales bacterium]|nr:chemotaxis protein CheW [Gemmatimonadales bacterium]
MSESMGLGGKTAALRQAFDQSFAVPPAETSGEVEDLLRIRVAGDPYAIRLRDITGIVARRKVVPLPGATPDLIGSAGIRGGIVPVFTLELLLGYPRTAEVPPWMVLCRSEDPIALGFPEFEGYARLLKSSIHLDDNLRTTQQHVKEVARIEAESRPVISIPLIVATIRNRTGPARQRSIGQ